MAVAASALKSHRVCFMVPSFWGVIADVIRQYR